jgi:hypothetical protein
MSKSALRDVIRDLSKALADAIVKAINSHSLHELAALTDESSRAARPRSKPAAPASTPKASAAKAKTKAKTRGRPPAAKKKSAPKPATSKVSPEDARNSIIAVLKDSKEWLSANDILAALEVRPKDDLFGRVLRSLVSEGHVAKQGATRNTRYQITASGLAL